MTNTASEGASSITLTENFMEEFIPHDFRSNERNGNDRNTVKQMCWFYMNRNYCRYGQNCRFLHARYGSENMGHKNLGHEEIQITSSDSNLRTKNTARNMKESLQHKRKNGIGVQNQTEKDSGDVSQLCFDASSQFEDTCPHESNIQTSQQSTSVRVRHRNLYFYRSNGRNAPSHIPRDRTSSQNRCRYFLKGFCRQGDSCRFLHQEANDRNDSVENSELVGEPVALADEKTTAEAYNKPVLQNSHTVPVTRQLIKLQDVDEDVVQRLRDTEIQQLKKRFPAHELIKTYPEDVLHVIFSPSDPDWSFAVSSVPLEIVFSKEYPREACVIKVLEANNLPPILIWHLNNSINEWIKEKHQVSVASGKVELLFRPFLRWFDRNIEELFIAGLRKVKQDLLAKEAGIEFVPYVELPGAALKDTTGYDQQDEHISISQELHDIGLIEKTERSSELKNIEPEDGKGTPGYGTGPEIKADCLSASSEKEKLSHLLDAKLSLGKESELLISANTSCDRFSVPKLGTEVKLIGLELRDDAAAMTCTKIAATLQCSRCKTRHEINTPAKRNYSLDCIKCHQSMQVVFQPAILHQFSAVMGYLHLVDCQAIDIPLMECNFTVDCLNCSKQNVVSGIHYGQQRMTWCLFCNKKLSVVTQSVKFHQLQPASSIVFTGPKIIATKKDKKVIKDPAIQEGKPLPDCGTCRHYKKSYRWLRFPCCGKTYPCDVCHDEKEVDHEMKYANRMICGFCAKEQPYAGNKPCISCSSNMTKKSGAHWEGGKGCRDKITMCREDRQKYAGLGKTTSRKAQNK